MSFIATIKSLSDCRTFGIRLATEMPALSFSRMCYGYLQNDWITVVSSGVALIVTYFSIFFAGINQVTKAS
jgi:hypothetical protein